MSDEDNNPYLQEELKEPSNEDMKLSKYPSGQILL